jgi:acetyl-CoA carboxylase carboxyl transferase subunit beta
VPIVTNKNDEDKWVRCAECKRLIYYKDLFDNLKVCPYCGYHFRLTAGERIDMVVDPGTFEEWFKQISPADPLNFVDTESYKTRIEKVKATTGLNSSVVVGRGKISGFDTALGVFSFDFIGGSLGSEAGEKIKRLVERAIELRLPLIVFSASGGARMQEGILSLMQMAKVSGALKRYDDAGLLYISVMTNPTYGGTTASLAMLGDINIAEKGAMIGFAGPRVVEQVMKKKLPKDFQSADFQLEHGFVDLVVERKFLKSTLAQILSYVYDHETAEL